MKDVNPQLVEKYQLMLQEDPRSRVFAPLVDAYRKMGLLDEALEQALNGVRIHPDFAGGRIALSRVLIDRHQFEPAAEHLKKAVALSPENNLAYSLLAEVFVRLKQPKEALQTYKMVLFSNPEDERAQKAVKKLESLTADEFDDEVFKMMPLNSLGKLADSIEVETLSPENTKNSKTEKKRWSDLERVLSLLDAFIVRNEFEKAQEVLNEAERYHDSEEELIKRRKILSQLHQDTLSLEEDVEMESPPIDNSRSVDRGAANQMPTEVLKRVNFLKSLLARIADRSQDWNL